MKVLWVTNLPMRELDFHLTKKNAPKTTQSWLTALIPEISERNDIQLATATVREISEFVKIYEGDICHYALPIKKGEHLKYPMADSIIHEWTKVINDFKPDLIHFHGTEFSHGLTLHESFKEIPSVISIQGLTTLCERHYYAGIPKNELLKRKTLYNWIYGGIPEKRKEFQLRSEYEKKFISSVENIIGRTDWDHAFVQSLNSKIKYFHCEEAMREPFFGQPWNLNNAERHTIFTPAAYYPIKGFHLLLEAASILRNSYPDLVIKVMGPNILNSNSFKQKLLQTDYSLYLKSLIKEFDLDSCIEFLGPIEADQIADEMRKAHTVVIPSAIENGCNVLSEAMLLGVPCVASTAGGMTTTLSHKKNGYSYNYNEVEMLAFYVSKLWENDEISTKLSFEARKTALLRHHPKDVIEKTIEIYNEILSNQ